MKKLKGLFYGILITCLSIIPGAIFSQTYKVMEIMMNDSVVRQPLVDKKDFDSASLSAYSLKTYGKEVAEELMMWVKFQRILQIADPQAEIKLAKLIADKYGDRYSRSTLNTLANTLLKSDDPLILGYASVLIEKALDVPFDPSMEMSDSLFPYLNTYSDILWKLGRRADALIQMQKALETAKAENDEDNISRAGKRINKMEAEMK